MIDYTSVKEKLEAKLVTLNTEREKVIANLNAYAGAIETVQGLLKDLEEDKNAAQAIQPKRKLEVLKPIPVNQAE